MKFKLLLSGIILLSLVFSGCENKQVITNQSEPTEISFSWWGNDTRNEYTLEAVKKFEELHPDISVKCSYSEWSGYQARNNVRMESNTEADVMQINFAWLEQYSPDGQGYYDINSLSDYIDLSNFSEDELDYGYQNGILNAIPIAMNTQTVYINKTIYDSYGLDIPRTWNDIFYAAEVMNGEVYPISMTSKSAWFYIISYAEQVSGKKFISSDGKLNFNADDIQIMLELYFRLINEKVMPQVEYFEKIDIGTGKYAGLIAWLSDATGYCGTAVENGYEFVVADYTSTDGNIGDGWYAKPATMYVISKNTSYPEQSAMLLDFLLNSDEMAELQKLEKGIPISKSAQEYLIGHDLMQGLQYDSFLKMSEYFNDLSVISPYFENDDMISAFKESCNAVLYEKNSAEDEAELLYNQFCDILENNIS